MKDVDTLPATPRYRQLVAIIEIEFRAEMQNHFHVVLRTQPDVVRRWPREKVVVNWLKIVNSRHTSTPSGHHPLPK